MKKPVIGFTVGDPGGIGPELILKCLDPRIRQQLPEFDAHVFAPKESFEHPSLTPYLDNLNGCTRTVIPSADAPITFGSASDTNGHLTYATLCKAIEAASAKEIDALVTAPACKESLSLAGLTHTGHTTILAEQTRSPHVHMGFYTPKLKTVLATVHIPLSAVPAKLTKEHLFNVLRSCYDLADLLGIETPTIAVAGLNPHAGENGLFGGEELCIISPFVADMQAQGHNVSGPYPADTLYHRAAQGEFDIVLSLYHDQGLIPIKLLGFGEAVNITLGLPFIRTSPDHGTAFDIAGQDKASTQSMESALTLALDIVTKQVTPQHAA